MFTIFDGGIASAPIAPRPKASKLSHSERLHRDLEAHRDSQSAILAKARQAKELVRTPFAEFVLDRVADDESREAEVLRRIAASLHDALTWSHSPDALPDRGSEGEREQAIKLLQDMLRLEQGRARSARRLAKSYAGIGSGLEQALLERSATLAESNAGLLKLWLGNVKTATQTGSTTRVLSRRAGSRPAGSDRDASPPIAA
ncbi:MAG TPA: hypothetical protein VKU60_09010 [Chloroflexota bacterium]|nr:hypothetical protein [Chloroflexota bacterium]